ncbi:ParB/RepB/Spo0J family partition protein [Salmonella enterica]|nr:ParB/RepB/Spo0J family partition protein [Salmonella enterica]
MRKDFRSKIGGANGKDKNSVISGLIRGSGPKNEKYTLVQLPHQKVYSKVQARKKFKNIDGLAATMKGGRQEQPITVFEADADGRHLIKVGERRWRACVLNDEPVWAQIAHGSPKPETMNAKTLVEQIIENDQREPLSPMEMAANLAELRDLFGMKTGEIAEAMGRKPAFVSKHLKLLEMPEQVKQLLEDEIVTYIETLNTLTSIFNLSEKVGLELVEQARTKGELTRDESQARLKVLKDQKSSHSDIQQPNNGNEGVVSGSENQPQNNSLQVAGSSTPSVVSDTPSDEDSSLLRETVSSNTPPAHSGNSIPAEGNNDNNVGSSSLIDTDHTNLHTVGSDAQPVESGHSMQDKAGDNQALNNTTDYVENSAKGSVTFYVRIDDSVFELVDKPSITENGEVYVFCREKEGMPEMQVPITDCMLHHASLTK